MKYLRSGAAGLCLVCGLWLVPAAQAADAMATPLLGSADRAKISRAAELLDAAVAYLRRNGPQEAFAAFNDAKGSFVYGPYYVYVVGPDGMMRANGGTQMSLAGVNVLELRDAAGKPMIRDLLAAAAQQPKGKMEYRWLNPEDHRIEVKVSLYQTVGDNVVSVGYYTPRATRQDAQALLGRAVEYVKQAGPEQAFAAFNNPQGGFMQDDQYVFAVGLDDGRYRASGASPQLNGMDVRGMKDAAGTPLFENMIALARKDGIGTVEYVWRNPATNAVESKHTLIQRVGDVLLGVGYYTR